MAYVITQRPPACLFSLTHPGRWSDPYASPQGEERLVLTPHEVIQRGRRDEAYTKWMRKFPGVKPPRRHKFQAVRVLRFKYSESDSKDWWEWFQGAVFRVYNQPLTAYDEKTKAWMQFYILCYEDAELVNRWELEKKGNILPPRDPISEPYVSLDKRLRRMKLVPTECCQHERHNTTGGLLPEGL